MEKLNNINLIDAKIEVRYSGKDQEGNALELTESISPAPEWTALLIRYLQDHKAKGQFGYGAKAISLQGSCGEYPQIEAGRWLPQRSFNG